MEGLRLPSFYYLWVNWFRGLLWRTIVRMSDEVELLSFEDALLELEQTVARLESGDLTLDQSLTLFERGQRLASHCGRLLDNAQLRIEQLTADGEIITLSHSGA